MREERERENYVMYEWERETMLRHIFGHKIFASLF